MFKKGDEMETEQIKLELFKRRRKVSMASIARDLGVHRQAVHSIIDRKGTSLRIAQAVADAIGLPLCEVFPEYTVCKNQRAA